MKYIYYSVAFIVIGAIIAVSVWYATRPVPLTIQGEFHSKQRRRRGTTGTRYSGGTTTGRGPCGA